MNTTLWFNDETNEWVEVELDESGLPLTPDRISEIESLRQKMERIAASKPPGPFWEYDFETEEWFKSYPKMIYPMPYPLTDSWTQGEDGMWYAPVPPPPPAENGIYNWNEDTMSWDFLEIT